MPGGIPRPAISALLRIEEVSAVIMDLNPETLNPEIRK
jgi:hypothetical protein